MLDFVPPRRRGTVITDGTRVVPTTEIGSKHACDDGISEIGGGGGAPGRFAIAPNRPGADCDSFRKAA